MPLVHYRRREAICTQVFARTDRPFPRLFYQESTAGPAARKQKPPWVEIGLAPNAMRRLLRAALQIKGMMPPHCGRTPRQCSLERDWWQSGKLTL